MLPSVRQVATKMTDTDFGSILVSAAEVRPDMARLTAKDLLPAYERLFARAAKNRVRARLLVSACWCCR